MTWTHPEERESLIKEMIEERMEGESKRDRLDAVKSKIRPCIMFRDSTLNIETVEFNVQRLKTQLPLFIVDYSILSRKCRFK